MSTGPPGRWLVKQPGELVVCLVLAFELINGTVDLLRAGPLAQDNRLVRAVAFNRAVFALNVNPTVESSPKWNPVSMPGLNDLIAARHNAHSSWPRRPNCD